MIPSVVTRESFHSALLTGDLTAVQAFFTQRDVLDQVEATNTLIINTQPTDPRAFALLDGSLPWFRRSTTNRAGDDAIPRLSAARRGHTHVIEWLFSRACMEFMAETLAFLMPLVAEFDGPRPPYGPKWTSASDVMESLFESPVFCEVLSADRQQTIVDAVASQCKTPSTLMLAIAHGARVNHDLKAIVCNCDADCVAMLEDAGAFLVGADIVDDRSPSRYPHLGSLLKRGIDTRGPEQLLIQAARSVEEATVQTLLTQGFLDVDARDNAGGAVLMNVACVCPYYYPECPCCDYPPTRVAKRLLEFSDINLIDDDGCTALHYAAENNPIVATMLLELGANPHIRDNEGCTPYNYVNANDIVLRDAQQMIRRFLERGVDPFEVPPRIDGEEEERRSLYALLMASPSGAAFVHENALFFERPEPAARENSP